jgi:MFS family permease
LSLISYLVFCLLDSKLDKQTHETNIQSPEEQFKLSDIGKLLTDPSYLFIAALCVTFYSAVFPFMKFAPDLIQNKFGVDATIAGMIVSILPFGTILFTPLFGKMIDKKGRATSVMIFGSVLLIVVHLMFAFLPTSVVFAYIPMFILGIAFSLVPAAMWPALAKIVPEYRLGTAYGLTFTIQNIGLMIFPYLIGVVVEKTNVGVAEKIKQGIPAVYDYTYTSLMLAVLGVAGMVFAFLLKRADKKSGYGLELPNQT